MKFSKELGRAYIVCEKCKEEMPYSKHEGKFYCNGCGYEHKKECEQKNE